MKSWAWVMWRREFRPFRISLSTDRRGQRLQLSSGHSIGNFYWALRDSGGWLSHLALIPTPIPFTNWKIKIFTVGHPSLDGNEAKWGDSLRLQFLKLYLGGGGEGQTRNRILNCPSCSMVWGSGHPWQSEVYRLSTADPEHPPHGAVCSFWSCEFDFQGVMESSSS